MSKRVSKYTKDPNIVALLKEQGFRFFWCPNCNQDTASTAHIYICHKCRIPTERVLPPKF